MNAQNPLSSQFAIVLLAFAGFLVCGIIALLQIATGTTSTATPYVLMAASVAFILLLAYVRRLGAAVRDLGKRGHQSSFVGVIFADLLREALDGKFTAEDVFVGVSVRERNISEGVSEISSSIDVRPITDKGRQVMTDVATKRESFMQAQNAYLAGGSVKMWSKG